MDKQLGGKLVASGGFGCIFKPALRCEHSNAREPNQISKLMTLKNGAEEFKQIKLYQSILQNVPNYDEFFLLDNFTLCKPAKLTNEDLNNYKKCKSLKKKGITATNINQSLDKIVSLNMPYGGIDVDKFVKNYALSDMFIQLNTSLIRLLVHGIVPMNQLGVFHGDVKDKNILVDITEPKLNARLIDWGLSFVRKNDDKQAIPRKIYRRPFQYNVPFSSVLFNKEFTDRYYSFLEANANPDYFQIREFIINYIFIWNDIRGPGHLSSINSIIKKLTINSLPSVKKNKIKDHLIEYDFTYYYIIEYLTKILEKYTQNGLFDIMEYFNGVFLKNIDIWGFVMTYIVIYNNCDEKTVLQKIKQIIVHFLFESPTEPINVSSLKNELTNLNKLFQLGGNRKKMRKCTIRKKRNPRNKTKRHKRI